MISPGPAMTDQRVLGLWGPPLPLEDCGYWLLDLSLSLRNLTTNTHQPQH